MSKFFPSGIKGLPFIGSNRTILFRVQFFHPSVRLPDEDERKFPLLVLDISGNWSICRFEEVHKPGRLQTRPLFYPEDETNQALNPEEIQLWAWLPEGEDRT